MSDSSQTRLVLLGLKGTGKTHFLVALDWLLDHQKEPDGLSHSGFADDRAYVQPLREKWLRGEEFDRTSRQNPPTPHQLLAKHESTGVTAEFFLPDLAGESFDAHFVTRSFPLDFCDRLREATGLFVFVHCDSNADHALLEDPMFIDPAVDDVDKTRVPGSKWTLEDAGPQTKLVDLLQFVQKVRKTVFPLRVAVMISAWDLVEKAPAAARAENPKEPDRFLSRRWPLLDQYLRANADTFQFRVFGVSARGGGVSPEEVDRLTAFDDPTERILIVDGPHRSHDLSRPVRWLLGQLG